MVKMPPKIDVWLDDAALQFSFMVFCIQALVRHDVICGGGVSAGFVRAGRGSTLDFF